MRIAIEGNIGSGKSTVLRGLVWKVNARVHLEPVGAWAGLLERFYADPVTGAMDMQVRVLIDFSKKADDGDLHIIERCPLSSHHVFAALAFQKGWLTDAQWSAYKQMYATLGWEPDAIIYIDTPVDQCFERAHSRDSGVAEPPTREYLEEIRAKYDALIKFVKTPVIRVDGSQAMDVVFQHVVDAIESLGGSEVVPV